ncbi:uncharacterized protein At4g26485-like [Impatiens glandulifera]|uniref:uncharacterized protein At4g26485-like n=1 Tax=Impatiens glandulifera TaxID=253017 RepID=UPI001FB153F4|nr:uncharacterized protein At4g26485-like [Impatiens glandulifera]
MDHAARKGNENPQADQKNKQMIEVGRHKDVSIKKTRKKKNNNIAEDKSDFSSSASLAVVFGSSASNITATSFNNSVYLRCNYKKSTGNIEVLTNRGATVRHGVDATKMSYYSYWKGIKFDRIIYNFPFSGCPQSESHQTQMRQHLELVSGFLWNAKEMLEEGGQIHISHKTNKIHLDWNLKELAMSEGLLLVEEAKFNQGDYPGYETKQGYKGDKNFPCNPSSTYMFASIPTGN